MTKQKILVTGGAGFIGSHTVVELCHAGYVPVIIDRSPRSEKRIIAGLSRIIGAPVAIHVGDCGDGAFLRTVFEQEGEVGGVIHFAAYKAVGESTREPLKYYRNNLGSLLALLTVMAEFGIGNLVFSSSCTVYGQPAEVPVTEATPWRTAQSPYGQSKQMCELIIEDVVRSGGQLKAILLRYFNPVGAHPTAAIGELPLGIPSNLVSYLTQTAAGLRERLTIHGGDYDTPDGTCIRDYIHVVDVAKAHVRALEYLERQPQPEFCDTFNLGAGRGNSVLEVVQTFERMANLKLNYAIGPRRNGDVARIYADISKAARLLQWKPELDLEQALQDAWRWQQAIGQ